MKTTSWIYIFSILALVISFLACEKEEVERPFARVETLPVTEVDSSGATFSANIISIPNDVNIIDHGFVWRDAPFNNATEFPSNARHISLGKEINGTEFSTRITTGLLDRETYFVRAYIRSDKWLVYGRQRSFYSQGGEGPIIESVTPSALVVPGDTIMLTGRNFGAENVSIKIGSEAQQILNASETEISFVLSRNVEDRTSITVTNRFQEKGSIPLPSISRPEIISITPSALAEGDTVVIEGQNFSLRSEWNEVSMHVSFQGSIISASRNQIRFVLTKLGYNGNTTNLQVRVGRRISEGISFSYAPIQISGFFPTRGAPGDTITIFGRNFFSNPNQHFVVFDDRTQWTVIESTPEMLKVVVDDMNLGLSSSTSGKIRVEAAGNIATSTSDFVYNNSAWNLLAGLPNNRFDYTPTMFVANNDIFYSPRASRVIWRYNQSNQNWRPVSEMPSVGNFYNYAGVSLENDAVVIQGRDLINDSLYFWRYKPISGVWQALPAIGLNGDDWREYFTMFSIDDRLYICFPGDRNTFWMLDANSDAWEVISGYNGIFLYPHASTSMNGRGYLAALRSDYSVVYLEYNPDFNTWRVLSNGMVGEGFPSTQGTIAYNGKVYFLSLAPPDRHVFEWIPSTQQGRSWSIPPPPSNDIIPDGTAVVTNQGIFAILGRYLYQWFPR